MSASPIEPQDSPRLLRLAPPGQQQDRRSVGSSGDFGHLVDYLRILHKRRWTAVTAFLIVRRRRDRLHLHGDAALRGAHAVADRVGQPERPQLQGSHRRAGDQGRLLPDAVQHPAEPRAGAQDARQPAVVGRHPFRAGRRRLVRGPARPSCGRFGKLRAGVRRDRDGRAVARHRSLPPQPDGVADPQQPARRREISARRSGAGVAHRERASPRTTSSRTSSTSSSRRKGRATGSASASPSSASRWSRPRPRCSGIASRTTRSRSRTARTSSSRSCPT